MGDVNEVRKALARHEDYMNRESWYHTIMLSDDYKLLARFARSVIEPPPEVAEAMERLRKWPSSRNTQDKYEIYRSHPFAGRIGGLDYHALIEAYRYDRGIVADWALAITAPTPEKP